MNRPELLILGCLTAAAFSLIPNTVLAYDFHELQPLVDEQKPVTLSGRVENAMDLREFVNDVRCSVQNPCLVMSGISRLTNVANNEQMRKVVWKRMVRQEYLWVSNKDIATIEKLAARNGFPLN